MLVCQSASLTRQSGRCQGTMCRKLRNSSTIGATRSRGRYLKSTKARVCFCRTFMVYVLLPGVCAYTVYTDWRVCTNPESFLNLKTCNRPESP